MFLKKEKRSLTPVESWIKETPFTTPDFGALFSFKGVIQYFNF